MKSNSDQTVGNRKQMLAITDRRGEPYIKQIRIIYMTVGWHSDGDTADKQQAAAAGAAATAESKQKLKLVANSGSSK